MRIVDIREQTVPISRYADPGIPSGGLNTSVVAIATDIYRDGAPVVGFGFSSFGRFGQGGPIRERFARRFLAAGENDLAMESRDTLDRFRAWDCVMAGEKLGGHGERCVAVGTLDMALWDAAAKMAGKPLYKFLADCVGREVIRTAIPVYASGGYHYPSADIPRLMVFRSTCGSFRCWKSMAGREPPADHTEATCSVSTLRLPSVWAAANSIHTVFSHSAGLPMGPW